MNDKSMRAIVEIRGGYIGPDFHDEPAAAFNLALIEAFCHGDIAADAVQRIFDKRPPLKAA